MEKGRFAIDVRIIRRPGAVLDKPFNLFYFGVHVQTFYNFFQKHSRAISPEIQENNSVSTEQRYCCLDHLKNSLQLEIGKIDVYFFLQARAVPVPLVSLIFSVIFAGAFS